MCAIPNKRSFEEKSILLIVSVKVWRIPDSEIMERGGF
jgi:hypothetical protein